MYKKILVSFLVLSANFLLAQDTPPEENLGQKLVCPCTDMMKEGVLPSARKCIGPICECRSSGFISNVEFLYFQPKEDGFEYATLNDGPNLSKGTSKVNINGKMCNFHFPFKPGFKVGLGFYVPRISWDVFFNWMEVNSKCSNSNHLDVNSTNGIIPLFWNPKAFNNNLSYIRFSSSKAKLDFSINTLDWEVGDCFFTSPYISLRLHGGLKGAVIQQHFYAYYKDGNNILSQNGDTINLLTGSSKIRSDSKGLGPRMGLDSSWNIYCSDFNIIASGSFAFLLTRFDIRYHEHDTANDLTTSQYLADDFKIHDYVWLLRPVAQLKLGLNWGKCLGRCCEYYLGMNAAYEMQYFWEQNLSRRLVDEVDFGLTYPNKGDLFLHGLVLSAHFEF